MNKYLICINKVILFESNLKHKEKFNKKKFKINKKDQLLFKIKLIFYKIKEKQTNKKKNKFYCRIK